MQLVLRPLIAVAALAACTHASAVSVAGNANTPVSLGSFAAGMYSLAVTGLVDLCGAGGTFTMKPDGTPNASITCSDPTYNYFNPIGSYTADNQWGPAGTKAKIGALVGTFNGSASTVPLLSSQAPADWFLVGYGTTVTLASAGNIYAMVNDTYFSNNAGAFEVTVTAVPEAPAYAMMLAGLLAIGFIAKRRGQRD